MIIRSAKFIISNTDVDKCPSPRLHEFAFIGRSNVGKSSLINMLTNRKQLAFTSSTPGKTQFINHFLINDIWYLVDLPGYGYAKLSKKMRNFMSVIIRNYILNRTNLCCLFVLIDFRHDPQFIDLKFMEWLGLNNIPFSIIFTKTDKVSSKKMDIKIKIYQEQMFNTWKEMPRYFLSSTVKKHGKEEMLSYINAIIKDVNI